MNQQGCLYDITNPEDHRKSKESIEVNIVIKTNI